MRVAFVGLGKLGLPVALAMQRRGHLVYGYDISERAMDLAAREGLPVVPLAEACAGADIVFLAVQTPHAPEFEGITRLPAERRDFDYTHLVRAARDVWKVTRPEQVVAVVSTVLPGTMERLVFPELADRGLCYNPSFIAMGTVERDFLDPEFVLLGVDEAWAADKVEAFYRQTVDAPVYRTTVKNAELIKVSYNTLIGLKIVFANTLMEICHKTGCDVDAVTGALKMAYRRLMSPAYLSGGMGDGGACHPRDNIALSWLARELHLSFDLFEAIMLSREKQAEWLADLMCEHDMPKMILGRAYKPETDMLVGSHAILVENILRERGEPFFSYDPYCDEGILKGFIKPKGPCAWLIGTKHPEFPTWTFEPGSVVIDPWRYIPDQEGVTVIRVGAGDRPLPVLRAVGS